LSEHLIVEKSRFQRGVETVLFLLAPPSLSLALVFVHAPLLLIPILVLVSVYFIGPLGNLYAARFGKGERITREERLRRSLATRNSVPFWMLLLRNVVLAWILLSSALLPLYFSVPTPALAILPLAGGPLVGYAWSMHHRNLRRTIEIIEKTPPPANPMRHWLLNYLPGAYLFWGVGIVAGWFASRYAPQPYAPLVAGCGIILGVLAHAQFQARNRDVPARWYQFNFRQALLIGMLQLGVLFAATIAITVLSLGSSAAFAAAAGAGGFLFGTLFTVLIWALAKVNDVRGRQG
jgi:hypothetical protein